MTTSVKRIARAGLAGTLAVGAILVPALPSAAAPAGVVGIAATPSGDGHWLVDAAGRVTVDGNAPHLGSAPAHLTRPVVGIAATPSGRGYWLVASDGGIFTFGDAAFHGSTGAMRLNQPIVGMSSTASGRGYWLVASDGGIFTFGDAAFRGSTGALRLNQPIVGMSSTPTGGGYWLVARDGGIFTFGDARFVGSAGGIRLNQPIVGMAATPSGAGYWLAASDGGVFTFGDAPFRGAGRAGTTSVAGGKGYALATSGGTVAAFRVDGPAPAPPPAPAPALPAQPQPPALPAPGARVAARWPFASTSPWNMPIGSGARFEDRPSLRLGTAWINTDQYSHPIYQASASDPTAIVRHNDRWDVTFKVPAGATAAAGSDGHLHVIDPSGRYVDENFKLGGTLPNLTTRYHVRNDLHGSGVGSGGTRAYGGSAIGGLLRTWELEAGSIRHALALGIDGSQLGRGPVWPATAEDGHAATTYKGDIRMGSLFAIPGDVDVAKLGLTPEGVALARALQDHGAYVVDQAGCTCLYAEPGTGSLVANHKKDWPKLRNLLRLVANNGPQSVGGGGTPRAPLAPPL